MFEQYNGVSDNTMGDNLPTVNLGTGLSAVSIVAGEYHTCALLNNRKVKCWGRNNDAYQITGVLGNGNLENYGADDFYLYNFHFIRQVKPLGDNMPYTLVGSSSNPVK